jgi:hypothetical protein
MVRLLPAFQGTLDFITFHFAAIRLFWVNKDMMLSIFEASKANLTNAFLRSMK